MKRTLRFLALSTMILVLMSLSGCEWIGSLFAQDIIVGEIGWATTAEDGMNDNNYWTYCQGSLYSPPLGQIDSPPLSAVRRIRELSTAA